jgi:hypothetical protein
MRFRRARPGVSRRAYGVVAVVAAVMVTVAGCSSGSDTTSSQAAPPASSGAATDLKDVCPSTVVFQKDWQPESEHGVLYNLLGAGYQVDTKKKKVTGPLVARGVDTGVKIEIRTGGPAVGFQPVPAVMYTDKSIDIGFVGTDESVQYSQNQPTIAVMAPLEVSPLAILWSPDKHPEFNTISDIGQTNTKVLYSQGLTYMEYLVGSGILRRSQLDGSYTGAPDLFVANRGEAALQGFITSEPYLYEHEIKAWGKPLVGQLVNDTGYPVYFSSLSIRTADKEKLTPCLKKLVPILQQSQIDFQAHPDNAIKIILDLVKKYNTGWQYSDGMAHFSAEAMVKQGIVSNGPDKTLGNFDMARIKKVIDICTPIFISEKKPIKAGLKPEDLVTNEFIDPKIGLPSGG